ncbi:acyltransferase, partial [Escherichia coli]
MKTVSDVLSRDNNNLDLIRIVAAVMVIYGHSFFLANNHGARELITQFFPFTYSGSIAVKIFFFISGLLVTTSLIRTQSVPKFVISRFFRIY